MTVINDAADASPSQQVVPVDFSKHFGQEGHARKLASLRVLLSAFTGVPGIIGLHGGLPPPDAFPFTEMSFTLRDGTKMHIAEPSQVTCSWRWCSTCAWVACCVMLFKPSKGCKQRVGCCCRLLLHSNIVLPSEDTLPCMIGSSNTHGPCTAPQQTMTLL